MRSFLAVLGLLMASTSAQQAATGQYGFGCGEPDQPFASTLSYTGLPRLGATFTVNYQVATYQGAGVRVNTYARLFTGFSDRSWAGASLPIWVWGLPLHGAYFRTIHCMIWASFDIDMGLVGGNPRGQMNLTVPNQPSLIGLRLYQQWFQISLISAGGTTTESWYLTNGGVLTIGL